MPVKKFALGVTLVRGNIVWAAVYEVEASSINEAKGAVMTSVQETEVGAMIASIAALEVSSSKSKEFAVAAATKNGKILQTFLFLIKASNPDEAEDIAKSHVQKTNGKVSIVSVTACEIK